MITNVSHACITFDAVSYPPGRSILLDEHAQQLAPEAMFLLVFASSKGIRDALLETLTAPR